MAIDAVGIPAPGSRVYGTAPARAEKRGGEMKTATSIGCACLALLGGNSPPAPSAEPARSAAPAASAAPSAPSKPSAPGAIDPAAVEAATGLKPEVAEGVAKVSYPRADPKVEIDGWAMPPFM